MPRRDFYEPLIQGEQPNAVEIRGFPVTIGGTYVLLDDVVTALREYAHSLPDAEQGGLVHEVATWLQSGDRVLPEPEEIPMRERDLPPAVVAEAEVVHGAESDDVTLDVDRVELFPVQVSEGRRKWHARSIDTAGNVMKITNGSFDKAWVEKNASERWPNIPLHEVQSESERSMTKERGKRTYAHELWAGHHA